MRKLNHQLKVNPDQFINVQTKEAAYILGYLWGDGWLNKNKNAYTIWICTIDNFLDPILEKTGQWLKTFRQRENRQLSFNYVCASVTLYEYLVSMNYKSKDLSACKILNTIPDNLKKYWFRGLSDADGCFYTHGYMKQYSIGSTYEQDWTYTENLFKKLNIKYTIKRAITPKGHKNSIIRFCGKQSMLAFGNYIYSDYDGLGLQRKYDKYKTIEQAILIPNHNISVA